jgi:hypothetical protein
MEAAVLDLAGSERPRQTQHFQVEVTALSDGRYRLRVSRAGTEGARARELATCAEAREAAILIMATALGTEQQDANALAADASAQPVAEPKPANTTVAARGVPPRFTLTLAALLDYGTLPGVGVGPSLDVSYAHGLLRAGVAAHYLPARSAPVVPDPASIRIDSFAFSLHGGALFRFAQSAFGPRAELELGALRGRPKGVDEAVTESAFWLTLLGGGELEQWFHSRVGMQLFVLVGPALRRPRFALADGAAVYTTAPLVLRAGLGVTVRIDPKD